MNSLMKGKNNVDPNQMAQDQSDLGLHGFVQFQGFSHPQDPS